MRHLGLGAAGARDDGEGVGGGADERDLVDARERLGVDEFGQFSELGREGAARRPDPI